jgi:predicted PhzF superfamily epimerase YddE/YHI9
LATLHVLMNELGVPGREFHFQTRSGTLSGRRVREDLLGVDLPRHYLEPIDTGHSRRPRAGAEAHQAGPQAALCVVDDYESLCALNVDPMTLFLAPASMVIVACPGGPEVDVSVRVFAPRLGLPEDRVTGSALCALAPWWADRTGSPTVSVRQASARGE